MHTKTFFFISVFASLFGILGFFCSDQDSGFSMDRIAEAYKEKFEKESSAVSSQKLSDFKSVVVATYQGAGMTSFTSLYLVKDSKGNPYTIAFSVNCPNLGYCDLLMQNVKVYDAAWRDITEKVLPLQELQSRMLLARKRPDYNEPGRAIDGFYLDLPEDRSGELTFCLTPTTEYNPEEGNSFFEFAHCLWNPETVKCEIREKEEILSP